MQRYGFSNSNITLRHEKKRCASPVVQTYHNLRDYNAHYKRCTEVHTAMQCCTPHVD